MSAADFSSSDEENSDFSGFESDDLPLADLVTELPPSDAEDGDDVIRTEETVWTNQFSTPNIAAFQERPGPNLPDTIDPATATPLDYFWLLFPRDLIALIVQYTNEYAVWTMNKPGGKQDDKWYDVTEAEMKAFLAINILMGICVLPRIELYWSRDPFLQNSAVTKTMTCNRFQKILKYFHVSDRASEPPIGHPDCDRLYKIRPILDRVSETFQNSYTLSREVSVDEGMIAFSGRLSFRQFMPGKPIKRGVKVWMLADANNAYLSRFQFYLGKQDTGREHGLGHNVVMKLTDHLRHSFRHVFFDNFFTGVELMKQLLENGLYACGTVRPMRIGFPSQLKKCSDVRNRGEFRVLQKGDTNLTASVWFDKKHVHHLSTLSDPQINTTAQRTVGADKVDVPIPHCVKVYNEYMGGVDLNDQLRTCYAVGRNGKKPWRYMFWFMLNLSIVNAFLIYKSSTTRRTKKRYSHLDFRLELLKQLIGGFAKRKRSPSVAGHFQGMVEVENMEGHINNRLGKSRKCRYHQKALNVRKETIFGCAICQIPLCKECHSVWHNTYGKAA